MIEGKTGFSNIHSRPLYNRYAYGQSEFYSQIQDSSIFKYANYDLARNKYCNEGDANSQCIIEHIMGSMILSFFNKLLKIMQDYKDEKNPFSIDRIKGDKLGSIYHFIDLNKLYLMPIYRITKRGNQVEMLSINHKIIKY